AGRTVPQDHVGVHDLRPLLHILVDLGIFHLALAIDGDPEIVSRTFFAGAVVSGVPHPQGDQVVGDRHLAGVLFRLVRDVQHRELFRVPILMAFNALVEGPHDRLGFGLLAIGFDVLHDVDRVVFGAIEVDVDAPHAVVHVSFTLAATVVATGGPVAGTIHMTPRSRTSWTTTGGSPISFPNGPAASLLSVTSEKLYEMSQKRGLPLAYGTNISASRASP